VRRHPPLLGEHNEEILKELGLDKQGIDELRAEGAIP
jgi:crotonobetainyl-CoA:carnitine CoA-transferase CaiB-like acyl-CoA transferase